MAPTGKSIGKGNDVEQKDTTDGCLVQEELHTAHLELLMINSDPDGVESTCEDSEQGEDDPYRRGRLHLLIGGGQRVVIGDDGNPDAGGHEGVSGVTWHGGMIEDEVDQGHRRREEDAGDLIEGDGGEGQGNVGKDDVQAHCRCQGDHLFERGTPSLEHGEAGHGDDVEDGGTDEEVKGGERGLRVTE